MIITAILALVILAVGAYAIATLYNAINEEDGE